MVLQIIFVPFENSLEFILLDCENLQLKRKLIKPVTIKKHFPPSILIPHLDRFLFENDIEIKYVLMIEDRKGIYFTAYKVEKIKKENNE